MVVASEKLGTNGNKLAFLDETEIDEDEVLKYALEKDKILMLVCEVSGISCVTIHVCCIIFQCSMCIVSNTIACNCSMLNLILQAK